MTTALKSTVLDKLAREVLRKLRLAVEAEEKEDREIICSEVFSDITCELDAHAKGELDAQDARLYFEVLAPYFRRKHDLAEALLYVCRRLWGQPHVAPIYAMLLYQWLLLHKDAGGAEQRLKHLKVMVSGMRQMMWGDVEADTVHMKPMHAFTAQQVVFSADRRLLDGMPGPARSGLLSVIAAYLPYYTSEREGLRRALDSFPSPTHTLTDGGHTDGEAADYIICEVTDALRHISGERGLLRYLGALQHTAASPHFRSIRRVTRLMLESELYQLTAVGGPRYLPRSVNSAAFRALVPGFQHLGIVHLQHHLRRRRGLCPSKCVAIRLTSGSRPQLNLSHAAWFVTCRTSSSLGDSGHVASSAGWPASFTPLSGPGCRQTQRSRQLAPRSPQRTSHGIRSMRGAASGCEEWAACCGGCCRSAGVITRWPESCSGGAAASGCLHLEHRVWSACCLEMAGQQTGGHLHAARSM